MHKSCLKKALNSLQSLDASALVSCYHDNFLFEDTVSGEMITDKETLTRYFDRLFALQSVSFKVASLFESDSMAAAEWIWGGHRANSPGIFRIKGVSIFEIEDDLIKRESIYYDIRDAL